MRLFTIVPVLLLAVTVAAEKKIELQDIEEDNLKSEKETNYENAEARTEDDQDSNTLPIEYLKSGIFRYFKTPGPTQATQQQRYIQQYDVTERQESAPVTPAPHFGPSSSQSVVNYVPNVPVQFYLVPQYQTQQVSNAGPQTHYSTQGATQVESYPNSETQHTQTNYVEAPGYIAPKAKTYIQPIPTPVTYVTYSTQPAVAPTPAATIAPEVTYQLPVVQYQTAVVSPPTHLQSSQHPALYTSTRHNVAPVVEDQENVIETQQYFAPHTEESYTKSQTQESPRYYNSRTPIRQEYTNAPSELPHPSPLLLKAPPPHLAHIPKALPLHRPWGKAVYNTGGFSTRPIEPYGPSLKRKPTSLLDSYIPSSVQIEYLKRGIIKDPLVAYETLSSGRHFGLPQPRHFERGFLPNQMFHTPSGGTFYGHYKRSAKTNKGSRS